MKKMTKILSLTLALVLAVGLGVGGTLAWLNATAGEVTNTFYATGLINPDPDPDPEIGSRFQIWEHNAVHQDNGNYTLQNTESVAFTDLTKKNEYKVVPGVTLEKDPFVYIDTAEAAYVYIEVLDTVNTPETAEKDKLNYTIDGTNWKLMDGKLGANGGKVYKYVEGEKDGIVLDTDGYIQINILDGEKVTVGNNFDVTTLAEERNLTFYGYAAQQATFATAEDAWNATFGAPAAK